MPIYTFLDLKNAIKEESRVDRGTDLDTMIGRIINEVMIKHCRNKEYPELYDPNYALTIATDGQASFDLPIVNSSAIAFSAVKEVRYSNDGTNYRFIKKRNQFPIPYQTGYPSYWWIGGNQLYISPYSKIIAATDTLFMGYFKVPALLVADGDNLLIDDLYPVIINEAISRVRKYHDDYPGAATYKADADQATQSVIQQ